MNLLARRWPFIVPHDVDAREVLDEFASILDLDHAELSAVLSHMDHTDDTLMLSECVEWFETL